MNGIDSCVHQLWECWIMFVLRILMLTIYGVHARWEYWESKFMFKESKFQEKHVRILVFNEETCTCMKLRDNYLCFIMSFSGDHVSWSIMWIFVMLIVVIFSKGIMLLFFQKGLFYFFGDTKLVCVYIIERKREREMYIYYTVWYDLRNTSCDLFIMINIFKGNFST